MSGLTQFAGRYSLSCETRWKYVSSRRKYHKLTTFYKMDNKLCPQYLDNCLPATVSYISDHNFRNDENYNNIT